MAVILFALAIFFCDGKAQISASLTGTLSGGTSVGKTSMTWNGSGFGTPAVDRCGATETLSVSATDALSWVNSALSANQLAFRWLAPAGQSVNAFTSTTLPAPAVTVCGSSPTAGSIVELSASFNPICASSSVLLRLSP